MLSRVLLALLVLLSLCPPASAAMAVVETGVRVQVDGAVRRPGLYTVRKGGRVAEAIAAAGGPAAGARLGGLNLARAVADGERCHVPAPGEAAPAAAGMKPGRKARRKAAKKRAAPAGPVDLNRASAAELDRLPGVGPATAKRILEVRQRLGRFKDAAELREVPGIGPKRLAKLRPLVVIR